LERLIEPLAHKVDARPIEHRQALSIDINPDAVILENVIFGPGFIGESNDIAKP
jgi:hypothetical protein